jgi:glycosyltransferase involved in cell wall biosynthesis
MSKAKPSARVLMVYENNPYPFDQRVRGEAETLAENGYEVTVVAPRDGGQADRETVNGVRVYRFPTPPQGRGVLGYLIEYGYGTLMMVVYTAYLLVRHRFDVVQAYNPPDTVFLIGWLAQLFGKRFVLDLRELSPELYASKFGARLGLLRWVLILFEGACCRAADLIFTVNESCRRTVITRHGLVPSKVLVVRNGPRLQEFSSVIPDAAIKAKAPLIIGYLGHMSVQDGVDNLLRALHHLKFELGRNDFYTVLIGPADNLDQLQGLAKSLAVQDHVHFVGKMPFGPGLLSCISAADICVEPAPASPLNNVATFVKVIEYMALGKPIVAFDLPETRFSAGEAAFLAQPNDEREFAQLIAKLMDSEELRSKMGRLGKERVNSQFSWQFSASQLTRAYAELSSQLAASVENQTTP